MKHIVRYDNLFEFYSLNEDVQGAKSYIKNIYAKKYGISPKEMSDSDIQKAFNDKIFKDVIQITNKNPGYSLPFLKFAIEQRIPIFGGRPDEEIKSLSMLVDWINNRSQLVSRLPMKIQDYANSERIGEVKGFGKLADDIRTLERNISLKWIVDRLPAKPREEFRKLPDNEKQELLNIANSLEEMDKDDPEKKITTRLLSKIKAMADYPIQEIIDYMNNYISGYSSIDAEKKLQEVKELSPEAGVLYSKSPYLVMSMRTEKSQKKLCRVANWCINRGSFLSYAKNALQINIFDYSVSPSDPMFLTGTTISYDGYVTTSHDINDGYIKKHESPREHFLSLGYPEEVVDRIIEKIPSEIAIKKLVEEALGLNTKSLRSSQNTNFITYLFGLADSNIQGKIEDSEWEKVIPIIVEILDSEDKGFGEMMLNFMEEYGVFTSSGVKVLQDIFLKRVTKKQISAIYNSSVETFDEIKRLYAYKMKRGDGNPIFIKNLENILKNEDKVLSELKRLI
jgi:hypothetical protein